MKDNGLSEQTRWWNTKGIQRKNSHCIFCLRAVCETIGAHNSMHSMFLQV